MMGTKANKGPKVLPLALLLAAGLLLPLTARAGEAKPEPKEVPLTEMLSTTLPAEEKPLYALLLDNVKAQDREHLKGRKPVSLTARLAALQALERSLDIQLSVHDDALRQAAMMEAKAAFLPVFNVSVFRDYQATYTRKRLALVFKGFIPFRTPVVIPLSPTITGINFVPGRVPGEQLDFEFASKRSKVNGQVRDVRFNTGITQLLPWGATVNLSTNTTYKRTFASRHHSYDAPWVTTLNAQITLPVPFTKDFGPLAPQDVAIKLSKIDAERAYWDLKSSINATLLVVDLAYWDLVGAAKNLEVTIRNRQTIELLAKQTDDALKAGRTTAYGKDQVDEEVLRVKDLEEQAWNFYVLTSDRLVELLNLEKGSIVLPYGYSKHVGERITANGSTALEVALENRPELKAEQLGVKATEVQVDFARHQLLPDLVSTNAVSLIQTNSEIGYHTLFKSLNNIFTEDARTLTFGLRYRYPLFNRALHARYQQALAQKDSQKFTLRINENQVTQEVHDALASLESAEGRVRAAQSRVDAASKAYEQAKNLRDLGRITEYEIVSKSQEYLSADVLAVIAMVDLKRSEAQLLFSQGLLPELYPQMTSQNEFDQYRLNVLKASKAMFFFNGYVKANDKKPAGGK
ncbi:MAG: TolC family protein [Planctomycetota bacterium]|nr:TolC family protein [Planctomycetota bacterium]